MRKTAIFLLFLLFFITVSVQADTYDFNLEKMGRPGQGKADTWSMPSDEQIVGASLFVGNIKNYNNSDNDWYVHLLEAPPMPPGLNFHDDEKVGNANYFGGSGSQPAYWKNLKEKHIDKIYDFDSDKILHLNRFINNDRIRLTLETGAAPVPEPATMLLFGVGLVGLVGFRKKFKKV